METSNKEIILSSPTLWIKNKATNILESVSVEPLTRDEIVYILKNNNDK